MRLTLEQTQLVQESWELVIPIANMTADIFYARLFEIRPELRRMCDHTDIREQKRKLLQMLDMAVNGLDDLDYLIPAVEDFSRRIEFGVCDEHYEAVISALLWTLEKGLGQAFTPATREAWNQVCQFFTVIMKEAESEVVLAGW